MPQRSTKQRSRRTGARQSGRSTARKSPDDGGRPDEIRYEEARAVADIQLEVAAYIETLTAELRAMARSAGLGTLAYFLEIARLEASAQVSNRVPPHAKRG